MLWGGILTGQEPGGGCPQQPCSSTGAIPAVSQGGFPQGEIPLKSKTQPTGLKEPELVAKPRAAGPVPSAGSLLPAGQGQMMCEASREAPSLAGSLLCSRGSSAVILALTPDNLVLSRTGWWFLGKCRVGNGVSNEAGKERVLRANKKVLEGRTLKNKPRISDFEKKKKKFPSNCLSLGQIYNPSSTGRCLNFRL